MSETVMQQQNVRDSLPVRRYTKEELLAILEEMDAAKPVKDGSDEEAAIVTAGVSTDMEVRDAGSRLIACHFRYIERYQQGKTTHAEDLLISLAVDIYTNRPTNSALILKSATQSLVLRQLDGFYKIEAQNFYRKSGDIRNTLEDYRQEAAECIFEKLAQYDPRKGKMSTYFKPQFYGRFMLLLAGDRKKYMAAKLARIDRAIAALMDEGIRCPNAAQIAQWINAEGSSREVSARQVENALKSRISIVPFESINELQSVIPGTEETVMQNAEQENVQRAADELDPVLQVIYDVWMQSIERSEENPTDKELKIAVKRKFPKMTDRDIKKAKADFIRQMGRKCGNHKPARRTTEKIRNIAEADLTLFDAIEKQYPDGLPDVQ